MSRSGRSALRLIARGLLPLSLLGCGASGPESAERGTEQLAAFHLEIVDDAGRLLRLDAPPSRIVSLVPSATEILLALGGRDRLVGRTDFDLQPELRPLPSVGGGLEPSVERLVSLRPDLVVRFSAESDPHTPRQLDAAGIPHLAIRPDGIADIGRIIGLLGEVTGAEEAAASIRAALEAELAEVERRIEGAPRPRVLFLLGGEPPLVAGGGTFLHELIEVAGGVNVFADLGTLYAPVSQEEVVRRAPDLVLTLEGARVPSALAGFPLHRVPTQIPGLQVGSSARLIAEILHPDRFR